MKFDNLDITVKLDEYYNKIVNYYDSSREKCGRVKSITDNVIYTFVYNISSSCNSIIKNYLLDERSPSDALLVRNCFYRLKKV